MQKRQIPVGLMGMNQDVRSAQVNTKQAFEISNLRLNSTKDGDAFELTSERGTKQIKIYREDGITEISFTRIDIVGQVVLGEYLVLFAHYKDNQDRHFSEIITLKDIGDGNLVMNHDDSGNILGYYYGDLGFTNDTKIDAIAYYENENVQKVYWIDGEHQTRVINICKQYSTTFAQTMNYDPFAFMQEIDNIPIISVSKNSIGGLFYAGVIQYAVSYYNKNSQETPIVAITPLEYISYADRGEQPNKQVGCSFDITITSDSRKFEYMRVYQIYRTSLDTTPQVKVIYNLKLDQAPGQVFKITDTNQQGWDFDAYRLIIPQTPVIVNTFAYKDQKLFEGNYKTTYDQIPYNLFINGNYHLQVSWKSEKRIQYKSQDPVLYPYKNQLQYNSQDIRHFKQQEWYKLGIQFQDKYGNWTQPIIIGTFKNNATIRYDNTYALLPIAESDFYIDYVVSAAGIDVDIYPFVRPVVSFPTISERSVLCQGIASPTVFNVTSRHNGNCYVQSSWFFRPTGLAGSNGDVGTGFVEYHHNEPCYGSDNIRGEIQSMYFDKDKTFGSRDMTEDVFLYGDETHSPFENNDIEYIEQGFDVDGTTYYYRYQGVYPLYIKSHNRSTREYILAYINDGNETEINVTDRSTITIKALRPRRNYNCDEFNQYSQWGDDEFNTYANYYYIDTHYNTLNSPDIEFDENIANIDLSQYDLHYAGHVEFVNTASKYNIIASNPLFLNSNGTEQLYTRSDTLATGAVDKLYTIKFNSAKGNGRLLSTNALWLDDACGLFTDENGFATTWNGDQAEIPYAVYPWQRQWLNNYLKTRPSIYSNTNLSTEEECSKIISKILSNLRWCETKYQYDDYVPGRTFVKLFNYNESQLLKLKDDIYYLGNVDQVVTCNSKYTGWAIMAGVEDTTIGLFVQDGISGYPIIVDERRLVRKKDSGWYYGNDYAPNVWCLDGIYDTNYNIFDGGYLGEFVPKSISDYTGNLITQISKYQAPSAYTSAMDPIMIRYKSTPHIVFDLDTAALSRYHSMDSNEYGCCMLFDVCKDISQSPYVTDDSYSTLISRQWLPCGNINKTTEHAKIQWTEGDTYFQRYDCLKTYPFSKDDYQSVVEIASFMVETHVNIDGRYDTNRGLADNTFITNENFNLLNNVYSQSNNFFNYSIQDPENNVECFGNSIIWSLNKENGADIDEWTRINTSSSLDLDGDKGKLTKLVRWRNYIYALQESGISRIKYNENVALATDKGVPIELSNSGAVTGKEYLNDIYGTQNKWTVATSNNGIYFVDYYTPGIYHIGADQYGNVGVTNITKNVLQSWIEQDENKIFNTYYDDNMNELLFQTNNKSLTYQDGIFTSFYDYLGPIVNYKNHSLNIHDHQLYYLRECEKFNWFYNENKDYYITFIANATLNEQMISDCIFDNVEYQGDVFNNNNVIPDTQNTLMPFRLTPSGDWYKSFNQIECWNSYQYSESTDKFIKKFRTWRVPIPRQDNSRARMRDNWIKIKLSNNSPSNNKFVLRNIIVDAFY